MKKMMYAIAVLASVVGSQACAHTIYNQTGKKQFVKFDVVNANDTDVLMGANEMVVNAGTFGLQPIRQVEVWGELGAFKLRGSKKEDGAFANLYGGVTSKEFYILPVRNNKGEDVGVKLEMR